MQPKRAVSPLELTPQQVEAMRQLAQFGSADAARSLGRLLGTLVEATQPRAQVAPKGAAERVLQPDGAAFSVHFEVEGGARLRWMMHVTQEGATLMGGLLLGSPLFAAPDHGGVIFERAPAGVVDNFVFCYVGGRGGGVGGALGAPDPPAG